MGGIFSDLSYNLVLKSYSDAYARTSNGTIDSSVKRRDTAHYIDLGLMTYTSTSQMLGLDANYSVYSSNGNVFDGNALVFQDNYYSYTSLSARPNMYILLGDVTVGFYYQFLLRNYAARDARNSAGTYSATEKQRDVEHTIGASVKYPLSKGLNAVAGVTYFQTDSNMKYEQFVKYSYRILNMSAGLSFSL